MSMIVCLNFSFFVQGKKSLDEPAVGHFDVALYDVALQICFFGGPWNFPSLF